MTFFDPDPELIWLFCMTHPDDELAVAPWIKRVSGGAKAWISWTHSTPVREAEARHAATLLGIPEERLRFFHAPDGGAAEDMSRLLPLFREMMQEIKPDRVVCGAFEQGHLDHDATNLLVNLAYDGTVLEAPFYHTYLTRMPTLNRFATDGAGGELRVELWERKLTIEIARAYKSQRIAWNLFWGNLRELLIHKERLGTVVRLRVQAHKDFLKPNLPDDLRKRVEQSDQWRRWIEAARAIL